MLLMDKALPDAQRTNDTGACWTCLKKGRSCDGGLPHCRNCTERAVRCAGYSVRINWPMKLTASTRARRHATQDKGTTTETSVKLGPSLSAFGLPPEESFFMSHYIENVARIALAIDYDQNGYRSLLPIAMQDPALMNAMLAVGASHHGRWQNVNETVSRKYWREAVKGLSDRFGDPELISTQSTLAVMLSLVTFEVFSGSSRWKVHYDAIRGWVRSHGDCSDLEPFLKAWVCMVDTQCALNLGQPTMRELYPWLDTENDSNGQGHCIDALFGCSVKLPILMCAASQLYVDSVSQRFSDEEILSQVQALQERIRATEIALYSDPKLAIVCSRSTQPSFSATVGLDQEDLRRRMVAAAEIFRHASHLYVYRIAYGPETPLTKEMQESLETALTLLTAIPDAIGPGANLGWCLVVIGAELNLADEREYIRSRWLSMHLLGMYNTKNAQRILEEVWSHQDRVIQGEVAAKRWQEIMQDIGECQILV